MSRPAAGTSTRRLQVWRYVGAAPITLAVLLLAGLLRLMVWIAEGIGRVAEALVALQRMILDDLVAGPRHANHGPDDAEPLPLEAELGGDNVVPFHSGVDMSASRRASPGNGGDLTGGAA